MCPLAASTLDATSPARPERPATREVVAQTEEVLEAGARAGDFVIEEPIGRGSFGTVYRASHAVIGRRAAVKVLRSDGDAGGERAVASFIEEARLVARLRHPNVVDVLTFGRLDDGRHFQVMDLIDGPTVAELVRERGPLPPAEALPILRGIASALDAVHRAGVVHRDLKPANVVLERRDGALHPRLIDFGVARLIAPLEADPQRAGDALGPAVGTPRYMSPEQCRGRRVDARADAYAFGLLAYELLTGHPVFAGDDGLELMLKHTSETATAPSKREPTLDDAADPILLSLLEKDPDLRPADLAPVVTALERALLAPPQSTPARGARARWIAVLGVSTVGLAGGTLALGARVDRGASSAIVERSASGSTSVERASGPPPSAAPLVVVSARLADVVEAPRAQPSNAPAVRSPAPRRSAAPAPPGLEDPENPFRGH